MGMMNGYMRVGSHLNTTNLKNMKNNCMVLMVLSQRLLEQLVNSTSKFPTILNMCQLEPMQITWLNLQPSKWMKKKVFLAKNCSKTPKNGSGRFQCYQMWIFTKIVKYSLFDCYFLCF